jgi:hypothetical protein
LLEFIGAAPLEWQPQQPTDKRVNDSRIAKPELDSADRRALGYSLADRDGSGQDFTIAVDAAHTLTGTQ